MGGLVYWERLFAAWLEVPVDEGGGAAAGEGLDQEDEAGEGCSLQPEGQCGRRGSRCGRASLMGRQCAMAAQARTPRIAGVRLSWDQLWAVRERVPRRPRISQALAMDDAWKKIQVKQTKWKVTKVARMVPQRVGCLPRGWRFLYQRTVARATPWRAPQSRNVQPMPCQRPPSRKVTMTGVAVGEHGLLAAVLGETLNVVAQPGGEGDVPATPEVHEVERRGRGG